jgi:hypothetical protein
MLLFTALFEIRTCFSCRHDEPEPDFKIAVNSNFRVPIISQSDGKVKKKVPPAVNTFRARKYLSSDILILRIAGRFRLSLLSFSLFYILP